MSTSMKNKTALVFGGSVFLGRAVVRKFLSMGYKVYVLNRGNHKPLEGAIPLIADRNNLNEVMKVCEGKHFDVVWLYRRFMFCHRKNLRK